MKRLKHSFYVSSDAELDLEELKALIKNLGYIGEIPGDYVMHF